ncbi:serine hydrolase domain-containing protein [Thalassotalea marina]|uniref:Beta-lactamase-related domain-containing protein n=1 Tax=Thalassotalea marina TaxID=1673741 RepID=A0A919BPF8_9GAMM|nr:serine hydrolase domain-containing protein [Thalassotalea marina]GHG03165.1 hypothetical protein GCM10017161_35390 [Thalassotalea marina]
MTLINKVNTIVCFTIISAWGVACHAQESLESVVERLANSASIPGVSAGYIDGKQHVQLATFGQANSKSELPVSNDTIFQAASLSKPVLAFIVLKMAQRGELSLDQPLHQILPYKRLVNKAWAELLTPRLILSHQSGLPNWGGEQLEFKFKPASQFGYSGEGYVYLQRVLEKMTGLSYQQIADKEVFKPLNMKHSYFAWPQNKPSNIALGHTRSGFQVERETGMSNAAASLHTTAEDYLKFIAAWFQPSQLSEVMKNEAFSKQITSYDETSHVTMAWGLGWGIYKAEGQHLVWHWGDNGVSRAFTAIDAKTGRAFVYFANSENGLAISKQMTLRYFAKSQAIAKWLGYGQSDSAIWQTERLAYEQAGKGEYIKSIANFEKVLSEFPENQRVIKKINWLKPLVAPAIETPQIANFPKEKLAGFYGDRELFVEQGKLKYRRGRGEAAVLTPLYHNTFKVGNFEGFRLTVVFDESNEPIKLIGLYENGHSDESPRSSK